MSRKIVFFDVDGTISSEETFAIPESTIKAMKRAQAPQLTEKIEQKPGFPLFIGVSWLFV